PPGDAALGHAIAGEHRVRYGAEVCGRTAGLQRAGLLGAGGAAGLDAEQSLGSGDCRSKPAARSPPRVFRGGLVATHRCPARRLRKSHVAILRRILVFLLLAMAASAQENVEYRLKAGCLYYFAKFTEWPTNSFQT